MNAPNSVLTAFAPETVLTRDEVAAWLKINPRELDRLGVPRIDLGRKTKRYLVRDVLAWLERYRRPRPADGGHV